MNKRPQTSFMKFDFDDNSSMNLHYHEGDLVASAVLVFVHGLDGNGYDTWRDFPRFIFEDLRQEQIDVALFDYFSGRRRRLRTRPTIDQVAETLVQRLQELTSLYDEVYLVCHSLGGLVAMTAVSLYFDSRRDTVDELSELGAIILFGTPLTGPKYSISALRLFVTETRYLKKGSRYQTNLSEYFDNSVDTINSPRLSGGRFRLPVYAGYGELDALVSFESATRGVDRNQRKSFRCNHRELVKPLEPNSSQIGWVRGVVRNVSSVRASIRTSPYKDQQQSVGDAADEIASLRAPDSLIVTEIDVDSDAHDWWLIYRRVLADASTPLVKVRDRAQVGGDWASDLLMTVHRSEDVASRRGSTESMLMRARQRYIDEELDLRVIGVGAGIDQASEVAALWFAGMSTSGQPHKIFYDFVADAIELEEKMQEFIATIVMSIEDSVAMNDGDDFQTIRVPTRSDGQK